ncbi:plasmid pRiA4b ORF-3 family protein [Variovorax sp. MHTC-1]|uniref:plasmid pRiA4b ORF-3 family protein n=1 Tax=Variovorax sp. MHTC-1 TaxID=2495593 RepID=UPI000F88DB0A|nr:plasmid pRiA4b ORF-3 family protein [Variovorax sp. MHTC-1]RST47799.1 plasmid pRiA4b ORF-3 family protein [Variovorax sp. MHTC-1]
MSAKSSTSLPSATQAYQLHVELEGVHPKVWRRLLVPITIKLPLLHVMLLWSTGWDGGHLHEFVFGDANYGPVEPTWELPDGVLNEEKVTLKAALGARKTFVYVYDYGDNWRHRVKVEKIIALDAPISLAVCIAGENACPPEDVGGAPGYEEFLAALADPNDPEHEDLKEWIGGSFDPTAFDIAEVNKRLSQSED